ncbi:MAG: SH3 domain-containing protein [Bacteroidetes bacterium]|jgi:hypothetical protein|nr:SH3 domain-containing protein [Bacteroidota bacterium]
MKDLFAPLLFLLFVLPGCSSGDAPAEGTAAEAQKPMLSPDSLRLLYREYRAMQADPMPQEQRPEKGKLYPVDEAPNDTAFFVYRQQLIEQLEKKEVFGLLDAVAKDVQVEGAAEPGMPGFVSYFHLDSKAPDTLSAWPRLSRVLGEGGAFSDGGKRFTAPYYAATWPADQYDPEQYVAMTGTGVRLRNAPNLNGQTLTTVSYYPIVELLGYAKEQEIGGATHPWVQIALENGTKGYVFGQFVGTPLGPRLTFEQSGGRWQLVEAAGF